jgi:paraquat-inducible protein B
MADDDLTGRSDIPHALAAPKHHRMLSLVWIVPMVAALVAGWLAVQAFLRQGPTITISFLTAEGLEPGITRLKYKDVEIGTVSAITLSPDRSRVIVSANMQKQATTLLKADTRFWVVRPRISASSVSGLGTLFSGAYIGVDAGTAEQEQREFVGLEVPPLVIGGRPGTQFLLRSEALGGLDVGSPVYFRQVQAGQVVAVELDEDGRGTSIRVFINAPYDRFVKPRSRFWVASGIEASFNASGFELNTESLVSILVGGIVFRTPPDAFEDPAAQATAQFQLFPDEKSALRQPDTLVVPAIMIFHESVRGLAPGAPLDFRGIQIGEVRGIDFAFDRSSRQWSIEVRADLYPNRLRGRTQRQPDDGELLERMVRRGLSAQLRQGNLLTGQLYIALDVTPGKHAAQVVAKTEPLRIPTAPSSFTELQTTVANIARKVEQLPLDEFAADMKRFLQSLEHTLAGIDRVALASERELVPELRQTLTELRTTLTEARSVLDANAPAQSDLREMLREVSRAAEAIRVLADTIERRPEVLIRGRQEDP